MGSNSHYGTSVINGNCSAQNVRFGLTATWLLPATKNLQTLLPHYEKGPAHP
jgi:hypothetical protein